MTSVAIFREEELRTNLRDLAIEVLRELWMSSRKVGLYSFDHPGVQRAAAKPFFYLVRYFKYKSAFSCVIQDRRLFVGGTPVPPLVFTKGLVAEWERAAVDSVLFRSEVTVNDLAVFLDRLSKRFPPSDYHNQYLQYLTKRKVFSIEINGDLAKKIFSRSNLYDPELEYDFSVEGMAAELLRREAALATALLAGEWKSDREALEEGGVEFRLAVLREFAGAVIGTYSEEKLLALVESQISGEDLNLLIEKSERVAALKNLLRSLAQHPQKDKVFGKVKELFTARGVQREIYEQTFDLAALFRFRSSEETEALINKVFSSAFAPDDFERFREVFPRLVASRQEEKLHEIFRVLLLNLTREDHSARQKALFLIRATLESLDTLRDEGNFDFLIDDLLTFVAEKKETFEFSEVFDSCLKICLKNRRYQPVAKMALALRQRLGGQNPDDAFGNVVAQKALEFFGADAVVEQLVGEIVEGKTTQIQAIRQALTAINNQKVALALAEVVTHPDRAVRQNALKILLHLGSNSLETFSRILNDGQTFIRQPDGNTLTQAAWFRVRNAIHVLGNLRDERALEVLGRSAIDPDPRVRGEVVRALEKIGGTKAGIILKQLASDRDGEVRKTAIITLGLVGTPDDVIFLRELFLLGSPERLPIFYAAGNLGGVQAKAFFLELLQPNSAAARLAFGRGDDVQVKAAIVKGLAKVNDPECAEKVRELGDSLTNTQKVFIKNILSSKTPKKILSRLMQ